MKQFAPTLTDGYKVGHGSMYADGTESVYANLTPRTNKIYLRNCTKFYDGKLVFVGAYGAVQELQEVWNDSFFTQPKEKVIGRYARRMKGYFGKDMKAVEQMAALHDLGYLPLEIKTLPEGIRVPMGVPVLTIKNTIPEFFWLVNYLETFLSNMIWKSSTNATIAGEYNAISRHYAKATGCFDEFAVGVQNHSFACRGMSGMEDDARSNFGHLLFSLGTDCLPTMDYAEDYYNAEGFIACSVAATEHAVATSNILYLEEHMIDGGYVLDARLHAELEFMNDLITRKFPTGIVSYVADSFDFWAVLTKILPAMKEIIMARESDGVTPGKLVVRPDSGDPVEVVCGLRVAPDDAYLSDLEGYDVIKHGDKYFRFDLDYDFDGCVSSYNFGEEVSEAEVKGAMQVLWDVFGGTETSTGHKLLDSHIGLIYGDSITTKRAEEILRRLAEQGFASVNIVFGVGSYTYQCNTRDTFGFAVKATHTVVNGEPIAIFKDPKTDSKKKSAKGLLRVEQGKNGVYLKDDVTPEEEAGGLLTVLFKDGRFEKSESLMAIRERVKEDV